MRRDLPGAENVNVAVRMDKNSGRWDKPAALMVKALTDSMEHSNITHLTEVAGKQRAPALKAACKKHDWALAHAGARPLGECAVVADKTVWSMYSWEPYEIGPDLGPGSIEVAVVAVLDHVESGIRLLTTEAHLPATVEGVWSKKTPRVLAYRKCIVEWKKVIKAAESKHHPDAVIITADWNLDLHKAWVRAWVKVTFPGYSLVKEIPKRGSHGAALNGRLIDWCLTKNVKDATLDVLDGDGSSDHKRVRIAGLITHMLAVNRKKFKQRGKKES